MGAITRLFRPDVTPADAAADAASAREALRLAESNFADTGTGWPTVEAARRALDQAEAILRRSQQREGEAAAKAAAEERARQVAELEAIIARWSSTGTEFRADVERLVALALEAHERIAGIMATVGRQVREVRHAQELADSLGVDVDGRLAPQMHAGSAAGLVTRAIGAEVQRLKLTNYDVPVWFNAERR